MDLGWISEYYVQIIILACLGIGYMIKATKIVPDRFIPLILGILGAGFGFITQGFTFMAFTSGMISGLASTGFHQIFKQLIEKGDDKDDTK